MPQNKDLKRLARARMAESGENYTQALARVRDRVSLEPLPPVWNITGSRASDYEVGLVPGASHEGNRVARLRLRPAVSEPSGFGTLMQSIAATRYVDRRVRFSALARAAEVTGWAGLWLRADGPSGTMILDNMRDRPLRGTTGWTEASIVLDVPEQATALHFGVLLSGAGAVDLARSRFETVGEDVPVTAGLLPDQPQALDFGGSRDPRWGFVRSGRQPPALVLRDCRGDNHAVRHRVRAAVDVDRPVIMGRVQHRPHLVRTQSLLGAETDAGCGGVPGDPGVIARTGRQGSPLLQLHLPWVSRSYRQIHCVAVAGDLDTRPGPRQVHG